MPLTSSSSLFYYISLHPLAATSATIYRTLGIALLHRRASDRLPTYVHPWKVSVDAVPDAISSQPAMQPRRGGQALKHPTSSRLPAIAPREEHSLQSQEQGSSGRGTTDPPRTRLPPRSRNGCWYEDHSALPYWIWPSTDPVW